MGFVGNVGNTGVPAQVFDLLGVNESVTLKVVIMVKWANLVVFQLTERFLHLLGMCLCNTDIMNRRTPVTAQSAPWCFMHEVWPEPVTLIVKLCGDMKGLWKTASFMEATCISTYWMMMMIVKKKTKKKKKKCVMNKKSWYGRQAAAELVDVQVKEAWIPDWPLGYFWLKLDDVATSASTTAFDLSGSRLYGGWVVLYYCCNKVKWVWKQFLTNFEQIHSLHPFCFIFSCFEEKHYYKLNVSFGMDCSAGVMVLNCCFIFLIQIKMYGRRASDYSSHMSSFDERESPEKQTILEEEESEGDGQPQPPTELFKGQEILRSGGQFVL